jgi:hypothetical protein
MRLPKAVGVGVDHEHVRLRRAEHPTHGRVGVQRLTRRMNFPCTRAGAISSTFANAWCTKLAMTVIPHDGDGKLLTSLIPPTAE